VEIAVTTSNQRWRIAQKSEKKHWAERSEKQRSDEVLRDYYKFLKKFLALGDSISVLDVGSGPFGMISYFKGGVRCALDPLVDDYLKKSEITEGITMVKGVAESLPFVDGSFDVIVSTNAIDHMIKPALMLGEIYRVMKKRGYALVSVYCSGLLTKVILDLREKIEEGDALHQHHLSFVSMVHLLNPLFNIKAIVVGLRGVKNYSEEDILIQHLRALKISKFLRTVPRYLIELFDRFFYPPVEYIFLMEKHVHGVI